MTLRTPIPGPEATVRKMFTDRRAIFDSAVPPFLFVGVNAFAGLGPAVAASATWGVGTVVYRLVRRQQLSYVFSGLVGLGIAVLIAVRTGRAANFFLPGVVIGVAYGTVAIASAIARRPASAFVVRFVEGKSKQWYEQAEVRSAHVIVTYVWGLFFLARALLRWILIDQNNTGALAVTAFVLGYPATAAMVLGTYAFLKKKLQGQQQVPEDVPASLPAPSRNEPQDQDGT